jgi:hypothetical protein
VSEPRQPSVSPAHRGCSAKLYAAGPHGSWLVLAARGATPPRRPPRARAKQLLDAPSSETAPLAAAGGKSSPERSAGGVTPPRRPAASTRAEPVPTRLPPGGQPPPPQAPPEPELDGPGGVSKIDQVRADKAQRGEAQAETPDAIATMSVRDLRAFIAKAGKTVRASSLPNPLSLVIARLSSAQCLLYWRSLTNSMA